MPALPPVPNVLRVVLRYKSSNDLDVINRVFFRYTGGAPGNAAMTTFAGSVAAQWASHLAALANTNISLIQTEAVDLTSASGALGVDNTVHAGTRAGEVMPAGTAVLINGDIQRRYRGGKPRTYFPGGVPNDLIDGQNWTAAFLASMTAGWGGFISGVAAAPPAGTTIPAQCFVSYYHGFTVFTGSTGRARNVSTPRPTPIVDDGLNFSVNGRVASQRRRNRP